MAMKLNSDSTRDDSSLVITPSWLRGLWAVGFSAFASSFVIQVIEGRIFIGLLGIFFGFSMVFLSAWKVPFITKGAVWLKKVVVFIVGVGFLVLFGANLFLALA